MVSWLRWLSPLWRDASAAGHSHASAGDAGAVTGSLAQAARRGVAASMVAQATQAGVGAWTARRRDGPRQPSPSQSLAKSGAGAADDSDWCPGGIDQAAAALPIRSAGGGSFGPADLTPFASSQKRLGDEPIQLATPFRGLCDANILHRSLRTLSFANGTELEDAWLTYPFRWIHCH